MDFSITTTQRQAENRSWLLSPHGAEPGTNPSLTLDVAAFTKADHFPNDYIPSGIILGKITATGLYGPYDPAAVDGRQTAKCILFGSLNIGSGTTRVGGAGVVHGFIKPERLPIQAGTGSLDEAARAALPLIHFGL